MSYRRTKKPTPLGRPPAMTVRTHYVTLRDLRQHRLPVSVTEPVGDREPLVAQMIELEDDRIVLATVGTRMRPEVVEQPQHPLRRDLMLCRPRTAEAHPSIPRGRTHIRTRRVGEGGFEPPTACPQSRCATAAPLPGLWVSGGQACPARRHETSVNHGKAFDAGTECPRGCQSWPAPRRAGQPPVPASPPDQIGDEATDEEDDQGNSAHDRAEEPRCDGAKQSGCDPGEHESEEVVPPEEGVLRMSLRTVVPLCQAIAKPPPLLTHRFTYRGGSASSQVRS